jgi:hypothetical protein
MIQRGKGAFLVNAISGHELVGSSPAVVHAVDSKVIVTTDELCCDKKVRHNVVHHRQLLPPSTRSLPTTTTLECPLTPAEVAADDDLMERIKTTSAQERSQFIRDEQRELNRAISISKQEVDRLQQEEEEQLEAILKQSRYEQSLRHEEEEKRALAEALLRSQEDDEIQRRKNDKSKREEEGEDEERLAAVLWESSQEEEKVVREEELALQLKRAISISQLEVISQNNNNDDDDDKALHEALAQSMHDMNAVDSPFHQVLEMSLREETMSEDDQIQQALLLSLNETYDTVANVD